MTIRIVDQSEIPAHKGSAMPSIMKAFQKLVGMKLDRIMIVYPGEYTDVTDTHFQMANEFVFQAIDKTEHIFIRPMLDDEGNGYADMFSTGTHNNKSMDDNRSVIAPMGYATAFDDGELYDHIVAEVGYLTDDQWDWQMVAPYFKTTRGTYFFPATDAKGGGTFHCTHRVHSHSRCKNFKACTFHLPSGASHD